MITETLTITYEYQLFDAVKKGKANISFVLLGRNLLFDDKSRTALAYSAYRYLKPWITEFVIAYWKSSALSTYSFSNSSSHIYKTFEGGINLLLISESNIFSICWCSPKGIFLFFDLIKS
jgi:hypothetical protein